MRHELGAGYRTLIQRSTARWYSTTKENTIRLITGPEIEALIASDGSRLRIANFEVAMLQHSSYYFRLGTRFQRRNPEGGYEVPFDVAEEEALNAYHGDRLRFSAREYVQTWTHEEFGTDGTILGMFGPVSNVGRYGLTLVNSLFIDPLYPGPAGSTAPLELGLLNLNDSGAAIPVLEPIGKVSFFDISDSGPISLMSNSLSAETFEHRRTMSRNRSDEE